MSFVFYMSNKFVFKYRLCLIDYVYKIHTTGEKTSSSKNYETVTSLDLKLKRPCFMFWALCCFIAPSLFTLYTQISYTVISVRG